MLTSIYTKSKKAESDNITIFVCMLLFLIACFYGLNWYLGGALTQIISTTYHNTVDIIKAMSGIETAPKEVPAVCEKPFACKQPEDPTTCPEYEYADYKKICHIP